MAKLNLREPFAMIALDHAIFHLQKAGGISTWWVNHLRYVCPKLGMDITSIAATEGSISLINRNANHHVLTTPPGDFWYLRKVQCPPGIQFFHSSYFRVPSSGPVSLLTYFDAGMLRHPGLKGKMHRWLQSRCIARANLIHCISKHTSFELLSAFPWIDSKIIRVVHLGFDPNNDAAATPCLPSDIPFVVFVGKRSGYKQGNLAIQALLHTKDTHLVLAGGGDLSHDEIALIHTLGVNSRVHALGHVDKSQLNWLYQNALALWYPSNNEGFGFPVLEAAAFGCPVIGRSGHSVEEIGAGYALLHSNPNPEWIAAATQEAMAIKRGEWKEKGAALVSRFSWAVYTDKMLSVYRELGVS